MAHYFERISVSFPTIMIAYIHYTITYLTNRNGRKTDRDAFKIVCHYTAITTAYMPGRVAQSVGLLTRKSGVLGSIPGLATYFRFSFRFFKKGSCQLLAKVCA